MPENTMDGWKSLADFSNDCLTAETSMLEMLNSSRNEDLIDLKPAINNMASQCSYDLSSFTEAALIQDSIAAESGCILPAATTLTNTAQINDYTPYVKDPIDDLKDPILSKSSINSPWISANSYNINPAGLISEQGYHIDTTSINPSGSFQEIPGLQTPERTPIFNSAEALHGPVNTIAVPGAGFRTTWGSGLDLSSPKISPDRPWRSLGLPESSVVINNSLQGSMMSSILNSAASINPNAARDSYVPWSSSVQLDHSLESADVFFQTMASCQDGSLTSLINGASNITTSCSAGMNNYNELGCIGAASFSYGTDSVVTGELNQICTNGAVDVSGMDCFSLDCFPQLDQYNSNNIINTNNMNNQNMQNNTTSCNSFYSDYGLMPSMFIQDQQSRSSFCDNNIVTPASDVLNTTASTTINTSSGNVRQSGINVFPPLDAFLGSTDAAPYLPFSAESQFNNNSNNASSYSGMPAFSAGSSQRENAYSSTTTTTTSMTTGTSSCDMYSWDGMGNAQNVQPRPTTRGTKPSTNINNVATTSTNPHPMPVAGTSTATQKHAPRGSSERVKEITLQELSQYFNMPITQASKELKVGLTVLKKKCREFGIPRWPHRKMKSLDSLINNIQDLASEQGGKGSARVLNAVKELEEQKRLMEEMPGIELAERTKRLRQACFKASYKKRRMLQQQSSSSSSSQQQQPASQLIVQQQLQPQPQQPQYLIMPN